jgi:hypothetical protein
MELTRLPAEWPPAEVWGEVDRAAQAWHELRAQGRELRFDRSAEGGGIEIALCDPRGNVLRTLSPSEAVAAALGA